MRLLLMVVCFALAPLIVAAICWRRTNSDEQEEWSMRLRVQEGHVVAQFSFRWEIASLAAVEEAWLPLSLPERPDQPIGAIHSRTHEVRLRSNHRVADRQVVVLGPTPIQDLAD